jgi:hypothetical protein
VPTRPDDIWHRNKREEGTVMPATIPATGQTESRAKTKRNTERKTKEERAEISRRNARKSTGPRTAAGKDRSKYNATKHGLTARSVLLPGEDPSLLAARQQQLIDDLQPRHSAEITAIELMAGAIWRSDRSERAAGKRLVHRLRHEPLEQARIEKNEAIELGGRLFWQLAFPLPISKRFSVGKLTEPQCAENASHPHHPARLRLQLEQTIPGCEWLIDRWCDLRSRLCRDDFWLSTDAFKMVRLMGKHAIDMADDLDVTRVFLSSLTLISAPKAGPERESFDWISALIKMLVTFDVENKNGIAAMAAKQCEPFARRLAELPLARLAPADEEQARENLNLIIDQERRRLEEILSALRAIADADQADAPARLAFETGPEGERYRRYEMTNERLALQSFDRFLRTRNFVVTGRFDQIDVDLQDLIRSTPPQVEALTGREPAIVANGDRTMTMGSDDLRNQASELASGPLSVSSCTNGRGQADVPVTADLNGDLSAPSLYQKTSCGDRHFLRNEASEFVHARSSVVSCMTGGGPSGVPSLAAIQGEAWDPVPETPRDARPKQDRRAVPTTNAKPPGLLPLSSFGKIVLDADQARGRACTDKIKRAGISP